MFFILSHFKAIYNSFEDFETLTVSGWGQISPISEGSYVLRTVTFSVFNKTFSSSGVCDNLSCWVPKMDATGLWDADPCKFDVDMLLCGDDTQDPSRGTCNMDSGGKS